MLGCHDNNKVVKVYPLIGNDRFSLTAHLVALCPTLYAFILFLWKCVLLLSPPWEDTIITFIPRIPSMKRLVDYNELPSLVLPTIVLSQYDEADPMVLPEERGVDRERIRSLSGGAKAASPSSSTSSISSRFRRQSGDDNKKMSAVLDAFRPRSKSDSKGKRPTFMSSLRSSMGGGSLSRSTVVSPTSPLATHSTPPYVEPHRPRSGSDSRGAVSKMFDMLRNRSQSVTFDLKNKTKLGTNSSSSLSSRALKTVGGISYNARGEESNLADQLKPHWLKLEPYIPTVHSRDGGL
ncbi:hypothetical protein JTE90_004256 [Oedothorax gibbosus]|uniref:Uncharacterized protein n=1 Tax=Oedothorax gibbosus TaxID=931172 RepID=A0AAV6UGW6_9ARAC|nr:hypothetical protein JTE90_004256 [Oedothorax gibbosus]